MPQRAGELDRVTDDCRLIIAFFPLRHSAVSPATVEKILRDRPLRVDRVEVTEKGVLVFAESTSCESLDLTALREGLLAEGAAVGYRVRLQREDIFRAMHSLVMNF